MEWIKLVGEKNVPKQSEMCIVYDAQSERIGLREWGTHYFHSIDSDGEDGMQSSNITHWMPLPNPPPIVQQRLSGSAETASPKSPKGDF